MVGESAYKRFVGTTSIYYSTDATIHHFSPVFLQRNIGRALDTHAIELRRYKEINKNTNPSKDGANNTTDAMAKLTDYQPRTWQTPTKELLQRMSTGHKPVLCIYPKQIRLPQATSASQQSRPSDQSPEWLPITNTYAIDCTISYSLFATDTERVPIASDSQDTTAICTKNLDGNKTLDLNLDQPFLISFTKLTTKLDSGTSTTGARRWKQTAWTKYDLKFSVSCNNSEDAIQLLRVIDYPLDPANPPPIEDCTLRARYRALPECPQDDFLFPMWCGPPSRGKQKAQPLDHKMSMHMGWTDRAEPSALEVFNHELRARDSPVEPLAVAPQVKDMPRSYLITYTFTSSTGQARTMVTKDLKCQFCRTRLPQSSFERLHFHYIANHEHFKFIVKNEGQDEGVARKSIEVELADRSLQRASNNVGDDREFHWIRPSRPFDVRQFLRGDESWTHGKTGARKGKNKSPAEESSSRSSFAPASKRVKEPDEVGKLASKKRKRHPVPQIPGITLYRNISKRPLVAGEYLSESDDDVDLYWLEQRQQLRKFDDLSETAQVFVKLYDEHMRNEEVQADLYVPDALVRFCRRHGRELEKPLMLQEFRTKLRQLRKTDIIKDRTYRYCLDSLHGEDKEDEHDVGQKEGLTIGDTIHHTPGRGKDRNADVDMTNGYHAPDHDSATTQRDAGSGAEDGEDSPPNRRKYIPGGSKGGGSFIEVDGTITYTTKSPRRKSSSTSRRSKGLVNGHAQSPTKQRSAKKSRDAQSSNRDHPMTNGHGTNGHVDKEGNNDGTHIPKSKTAAEPTRLGACVCGVVIPHMRGAVVCTSPVGPRIRTLSLDRADLFQ